MARRPLPLRLVLPALAWMLGPAGCHTESQPHTPPTVAAVAKGSAEVTTADGVPVGIQLWSLRREMHADLDGTLAKVHAMGFRMVELPELYGLSAGDLRSRLERHGLHAVGAMFAYERLRDDPKGIVADARVLGISFVGCSWIPHDGPLSEEQTQRAAVDFERAGEILNQAGLRFFFHPHSYEFRVGASGRPLFEDLLERTQPTSVTFELDLFWLVRAGIDPASYVSKHADRVSLFHLKDMKRGTPVGDVSGKAPEEASVALGTGQVDIPKALSAGQGHIAHMFIEDESPDALRQLPESIAFVRTVRAAPAH